MFPKGCNRGAISDVERKRVPYIQLVKVLYCKLLTISKQIATFPHKVRAGGKFEPPISGVGGECYHCATMALPLCLRILYVIRPILNYIL